MTSDSRIFTLLGWIAIITLGIAIVRQFNSYGIIFYPIQEKPTLYSLPDIWGKRYETYNREGFTGEEEKAKEETKIGGVMDVAGIQNPADANAPYSLLGDVLQKSDGPGNLTAKTCYKTDFMAQSNMVGNYIQRTNNFKHAIPDDCSSPLTEMVNSFYRPTVI